jgi:hypothetical protein
MTTEPAPDPEERDAGERPEQGARLTVRLVGGAADPAEYSVRLATAAALWDGRASVRESDGQVDAKWDALEPPPAWLIQAAHALLRAAWQRRRAGHPWPRRLTRWRPGPDEADA